VKLQVDTACNLVSRIMAGDPIAESELVEQYSTGIRLMLLKRTGNHQLSNDICQEALIVTLKKLRGGGLHKPESLPAFVRKTAVYLSINHFRKEKRYIHLGNGIISLQAPHYDKKAKTIDNQLAGAILEELLDQLSVERDREILRRFYLHDEDKATICRDLDLSSTHFDRVLYRAKQRMRELIKQRGELKSLLFGSLLDD
jgi:RNA polymerase sigma-70 factor (ECF subfamily)